MDSAWLNYPPTLYFHTVAVGDRVLTSDGRSETLVDESWQLVELVMPRPAGARNAIQIRLLRPPSWLAAHGVAEGRTVWLAYEEIALAGEARVTHIGPAPRIAAVPGRVVLSTINQTASDIVRLRFSGEHEVIEATSSHRFYSVDRGEWVRADNLQAGEHVRTASGTLAISGVEVLPGAQRVFNLEVESEHEYFVSELRVLSHNTEPCGGGAAGAGGKTAGEMADELAAQIGQNRVGGRTGSGRVDIDLRGKGHFDKASGRQIDTPHVHESTAHVGPNGLSKLGPKTTRPATKNDIRTARELARREGLLR